MGDTGSERSPENRGTSMIPGIGEAECEAISTAARLRELIQLWSTLVWDEERKQPVRLTMNSIIFNFAVGSTSSSVTSEGQNLQGMP
jgi:hypothetical protein